MTILAGQVSTVLLELNTIAIEKNYPLVYSIKHLGYNLIPPLLSPLRDTGSLS